jgi:hypothetical protein
VRFWGEPPLVREPDLALFGVARLDPPEEQLLERSPLRRYLAADVQRMGAAAAAQLAVERIHANGYEFILHFDVDVITDFPATNYPGSGGLTLDEVREALKVFATQKHLAAIEVTAYNPTKDPDGRGAKIILDLIADVLEARAEAVKQEAASAPEGTRASVPPAASATPPAEATVEPQSSASIPPVAEGEAWSSDTLEETGEPEVTEETSGTPEPANEPDETPS